MAVRGARPVSTQFSSILQLASSPGPSVHHLNDFESMEDVEDLARLAASSSESISDAGHSLSSRNSASSANHSFYSPLLRSTSFQSNAKFSSDPAIPPLPNNLPKYKGKRPGRSSFARSADHDPASNQQPMPSPSLPTRSKSFNVNVLRRGAPQGGSGNNPQAHLPAVDETSTAPTASLPLSNGGRSACSSQPTTPATPSSVHNILRASAREVNAHVRRRSLDLGQGKVQAGIRRLKRSQSTRTMHIGDRPRTAGAEMQDRTIQKLHAEPQLTEQQRLLAVKRARKIAQVFGSEAPVELIQGADYHCRRSTDRRDFLSTLLSTDAPPAPPSVGSARRRSNSSSSTSVSQTRRRSSSIKTSPNDAEPSARPPSDTIPNDSSEAPEPPSPTSTSATFRERRRRAAKLSQFFGVNYQDISESVRQTFVMPAAPKQDTSRVPPPVVEVDVKVAGRRFWGLADSELKTADVADVIDKLRGLKAAS
ncbi:hypothetical protein LshimejAT787_0305960 [Lyophyllum shimeji]|uniref:Uncharacterized protein n=1 Tax=Lyophyllum shimeji TaxID=47721 RepID=A0A9P3UK52_LYOSH|nr:hypothetical protein LshimejAT787_0305960 [Lyophyllum shimeji]